MQDAHEPQSHQTPAPKPSGSKSQNALLKTMVIGALAGIAILGAAAVGVLVFGIYKYGWENKAASVVTHALPLPAATVNGTTITYATYLDDVATVRRFFTKQGAENPELAAGMPADGELHTGVLDRLIATEILKQEAARLNVTVTDEDIDNEYQQFLASGESPEAANQILDLYGWTIEQFKEKVMLPYLLQQKLAEALGNDPTLGGDAEARANEVLQKVKDGGDFAELAREYSVDPSSAENGGDLGEFGRGIMVSEFEEAAFALKAGEVSGLVRSQFGWHIIKVHESIVDKKTDEVTQVKASHILIAGPNVQEYLDQKLQDATIKKYVKL